MMVGVSASRNSIRQLTPLAFSCSRVSMSISVGSPERTSYTRATRSYRPLEAAQNPANFIIISAGRLSTV